MCRRDRDPNDPDQNVADDIFNIIESVLGKRERKRYEKACGMGVVSNGDADELTKKNKIIQSKEITELKNQIELLTSKASDD